MEHILSTAIAYAQAKVNEAFALKSGTSEEYDSAVKRSDELYNNLLETISAMEAGDHPTIRTPN